MDIPGQIEQLVSKSETIKALDLLYDYCQQQAGQYVQEVVLLKAAFNKAKRSERMGLSSIENEQNRINLAILEILSVIKNENSSQTSASSHSSISKSRLKILIGNIDVIIRLHRNSLKRLIYFAGILISLGLILLFYFQFISESSEATLKMIMSVASLIPVALSGLSFKDINQKYESIGLCKNFRLMIENILDQADIDEDEYAQDIIRIKTIINKIQEKAALTA